MSVLEEGGKRALYGSREQNNCAWDKTSYVQDYLKPGISSQYLSLHIISLQKYIQSLFAVTL